jgi:hypothetical protein
VSTTEGPNRFPREFSESNAPAGVIEAIRILMPALLTGPQPFVSTLRAQYEKAVVASIQLTGHGFYADFIIPTDLQRTNPASYSGGDAVLAIDNSVLGGGCVVHVRDGRLATLEVYTWGDEGWNEDSRLTQVTDVMAPLPASSE